MRILNFWRQVAAVLRNVAYPKTPAEHWAEQALHHKPAPETLERAVNAAVKGEVSTIEAHGRTWHKGPPPHVGWWNAAFFPELEWASDTWRWWDGKNWTLVREVRDAADATLCTRYGSQLAVWWTDYYPEDAVVPRMTPEQWKERARAGY